MRALRTFFAWLLIAALPLHGIAAAGMLGCGPVAQLAGAPATASAHAHHGPEAAGDGHHEHAAAADEAGPHAHGAADGASTCGICAAGCHSAAATASALPLAGPHLPRADLAEPFVRIHSRTTAVPDKPPRG